MPFSPHPTAFRTRHWRRLYESYILELGSLRKTVDAGAIFVVIDAEPWGADGSKPAEIGISLLGGLDTAMIDASSRAMIWTLDSIFCQYHIETHRIRVSGRDRQEKRRQPHRFGQQHELADDQVEQTVSDIIRRFTQQNQTHGQKLPLILTGFSLHFEFRILSSLYPGLLQLFTSWSDLQEVTRQSATDDDRRILPSLSETLIAGGFQDVASQNKRLLHNAATDTTQAAALLIRLLGLGKDDKLNIQCSPHKAHPRTYRKDPLKKAIWKNRPIPKELFPYAAKVSRNTEFTMLQTAQPLLDLFTDYRPIAAGLSGDKKHGWVCLPDVKTLEDFVCHVHMSTLDGDVWTAISTHDATIVPAKDITELRLTQKASLQALADEKRKQRSQKTERD